ncbi:very short patch repair endonuclease [Massilia oculi]|uniref:very short patch repair endonuclease n=1 Tax=Massilia oculi TaxID=945844 RepID=UPI001E291B6C|nr:very short patch repair endonuclease [Massilia oculi]
MTDNLSDTQRRHTMQRVKSKNTTPELQVRELLWTMGHRGYRLHRRDIPGNPDIAWVGKKRAIFINGCFWHGHLCARGARTPKTRVEYWQAKIERTKCRDAKNVESLAQAGWAVLILWECELKDQAELARRLSEFLN